MKGKESKFINKKKAIKFSAKKRFLIITAHPDDETLFSGGLLARFNKDSFVLCATHGLGFAKKKNERESIKELREREFKNALKKLGVKFEILEDIDRLDYHSLLENLGPEKTFDKINSVLKSKIKDLILTFKPDFIITHNPLGEYGHFLHRTIYRVVFEAIKELKMEFKEALRLNLLTFAPELRIRNINTNRLLKTKHQRIHCKLVLSDRELTKKLSALKCYSSQKSVFETNKEEDFRIENYHLVF